MAPLDTIDPETRATFETGLEHVDWRDPETRLEYRVRLFDRIGSTPAIRWLRSERS